MTGRFDPDKNMSVSVREITAPIANEAEDSITQRYDKVGVATITMTDEGGVNFSAESGVVLGSAQVEKPGDSGESYPQLIYMAVTKACKTVKFEFLRPGSKYGPIFKRELALKKAAALEIAKRREDEGAAQKATEVPVEVTPGKE